MPDVEDREPPLASAPDFIRRAVAVLWEQRIAVERADAAAVVRGLRECVPDEGREPVVEAPCQLRGHRIVPGLGHVADRLKPGELRVRPAGLRAAGAGD